VVVENNRDYPDSQADLRILVVSEDNLARAGLSSLISEYQGIIVAGQTSASTDLTEDIDLYYPDIIVWDLGFDTSGSMEWLAAAAESGVPIVVLAPDADTALAASYHGVFGLLPRDTEGRILLAAIRASAEGLVTIDTCFKDVLLGIREHSQEQLAEPLTPREMEVLQLVAQGMTNKAIALRLSISEHTVKFHVNSILGKLNAHSRAEAVTIGTRLGLVRL
jgi:DNA-binding NarL/FixJ family response regulator